MKNLAKQFLEESARIKNLIATNDSMLSQIEAAAHACRDRLKKGGTIYTCGNGGSTCDAMHFAEELVARYKRERRGFRAQHFMDAGTLTCWSNDYTFETAFARCAETFCTPNDVLVAFSTSGNSKNILNAITAAKSKGSYVIGLSGKDGGAMKNVCDTCIIVPSNETDRIQESHITVVHIICELIERESL